MPDCRAYELVSPEDAGITQLFPANVPFSPGATQPSRLAFVGAFGSPDGVGETINNVGDTYFATRTNTGWKTKYIGLPATKTFLSGGPPWDYGGYPPGWVQGYTGDHWTMNEVVSPDMSELVAWDDGYIGPGETYDSANYAGSSMAPYVWNTTNGKQLDRWPTNVEAIPGGEEFKGRTFVSKDLSHFVFTSNIPFAPGGEPGDMYDNNTREATIEIINLRRRRQPHLRQPGRGVDRRHSHPDDEQKRRETARTGSPSPTARENSSCGSTARPSTSPAVTTSNTST